MTGAPAPANDHHPIAFTRSSGGNAARINAIAAGPVAAPAAALSNLNPISAPADHATAASPEKRTDSVQPNRYTRLRPNRSPALPIDGMNTPKISIGPVTTHATVWFPTPNSRAIVGRTADSSVMDTPVEKNPMSRTISAHQRYRPLARTRSRCVMPGISSSTLALNRESLRSIRARRTRMTDADGTSRPLTNEAELEEANLIVIARQIREALLKDGSLERALADGHITTMQLMRLLNAISGARRAVGFVHPSSLEELPGEGRVSWQQGIFIPSKN
jgi:hypothetical protein